MKKLISLLLAMLMMFSLAACGGNSGDSDGLKIGMICVHDTNSGYDVAHIDGLKAACEALGIDVNSQVVFKYNIPEDETCYDTAVDLAEDGCSLIISDSYGHQSHMLRAAGEYPGLTFIAAK